MQYSDHLDYKIKQHRNASMLGSPISRPDIVTLANLSPMDWKAANSQHVIDNMSIDNLSGISGYGDNPGYSTWHLRDYMVG